MTRQEAGQRGGLATLERYGRAHFARITRGHPRRPRHGKERLAGRSGATVESTTTRAKGERQTTIIDFRSRAGSQNGPRPLMKGKVVPFERG